MKILGYVMLHYGASYLRECLFSLKQICDHVIVLYSDNPTHASPGDQIKPDTLIELKLITDQMGCQWEDLTSRKMYMEGSHREAIFEYSSEFDLIVNADSDEVWDYRIARPIIEQAINIDNRYIGVDGFFHFWRSFDRCMIDGFRPVRIHNLRSRNWIYKPGEFDTKCPIFHFGYAIPFNVMLYKMSIHGHKNEWRPDWYKMWSEWEPSMRRLHPVSYDNISNIWMEPVEFDKTKLPDIMKLHPFYNLKEIR
jgi:hypothetical protein